MEVLRNVARKKPSGNPKFGNETPNLTQEFEIDLGEYCSGLCRDVRSQLKRGSVYQSPKEASLIQKTDAAVGRSKIDLGSFSTEIIDSMSNSDEEISMMSFSEQSTSSGYGNGVEFCFDDSAEEVSSLSLQRSLSARFGFPDSPAKSGRDSSRVSSISKGRFSHVKNMFDPFVKSKSRRSPLSNFNESHRKITSGVEYDHRYEEKENHNSVPHCSPAHLHGLLKTGSKHGALFFQFSVKSPEDVYMAKTWKVGNASNWVYTFHMLPNRRKCSSESSLVGWMHVSCRLHTEFKGAGELNNSMTTEFVLYSVLHSRKISSDIGQFVSSTAAKLHPELEIAAIVMQVPLEKRESLRFKSGDEKFGETPHKLLDHCRVGKAEEGVCDKKKMHIVIPAGNHSLPASGSCGPSPLLDRWRSGGGCDCGGWDMACPLSVFTNKIAEEHRTELFVQGRKDTIPAFTLRVIEGGKYTVDFHAQLSSLQAFSICVAILHAAEAPPTGRERSKPMVQSDALKVYTKEKIKTMLDAIAEEEKSKVKKMEQAAPSFVLNPPFSPIARV